MDSALVRRIGASMEAQLLVSKLKKSKGKGQVKPFTSTAIVATTRDDLSYLSLANTVLGVTLRGVPLLINIKVPLELRESPRHQIMERSVLLYEE